MKAAEIRLAEIETDPESEVKRKLRLSERKLADTEVRVRMVMMVWVRVVWGELGKVRSSVCWLYCAFDVGVGCTVHLMWVLVVLCS